MNTLHYGSNCRMDGLNFRKIVVLALFVAMAATGVFGQKKEKLSKTYKEWLEHDVVYIITKEERDRFQRLSSDEARERTAGAPTGVMCTSPWAGLSRNRPTATLRI
jgi:hypothetical protein